MNCHYDTDRKAYLLPDDEPCTHDEFGLPSRHCTARKTCSQHIGWDELTCARCVGRSRQDVRAIVDRAAELMPEAVLSGVHSEAFMLATPAADVEAWSWRKIAAKQGRSWHLSMIEDDDDWHPYTVLSRWAQMLSEDYDLERPDVWTIANAAAMLDRILHRVAQDGEQDFGLMRREMSKCRGHIEAVLRDSQQPERGVPCPLCTITGKFARLVREYGHWCEDQDCRKIHYLDDSADRWQCPRDVTHQWTLDEYSNRLEERKGA